MPRKKACTERTRAEIVRLRLVEGKSYGQIAEILNISKRMAFNALQYFEKHKTTLKVPYKPRNRKTTEAEDALILQQAKEFPKKTMKEIRYAVFGDDESAPSTTTIRWRLVEHGIRTTRKLENAPPGTLTRKFLEENRRAELRPLEYDPPQHPSTINTSLTENKVVKIIPWKKMAARKPPERIGLMENEILGIIGDSDPCPDLQDPLETTTEIDSVTNKRERAYAERMRAKIVRLRFQGKSYGQISKALKISKRMAYNAVKYFEKHKTTLKVPNKRKVPKTQEELIVYEPEQPGVNWADDPACATTIKRGLMENKVISIVPWNGEPQCVAPIVSGLVKQEIVGIMPRKVADTSSVHEDCLPEKESIEQRTLKSEYELNPNDSWPSFEENDSVEMDFEIFEENDSLGIVSEYEPPKQLIEKKRYVCK